MMPDEYLRQFEQELQHLPEAERDDWLDEIRSHLEEGQNDPELGSSPAEQQQRLQDEMGQPAELARQLKRVHRSLAWAEYLLIVLPDLLLGTAIGILLLVFYPGEHMASAASDALGYRLSIAAFILLAWLAARLYRRQGSPIALVFFQTGICLKIIGLYLRGNYFKINPLANVSSTLDAVLWGLIFMLTLVWIIRSLRRLNDVMWYVFAASFFFTAAVNYLHVNALVAGLLPAEDTYRPIQIGWFGISQIGMVVWPAILVFAKQRDWRWFAIFISLIPTAVWHIPASMGYPALVAANLAPNVVVAIFWALDIKERQRLKRITG
jgi:MFS family permease